MPPRHNPPGGGGVPAFGADSERRLAEAGWPLDGVNDHGTHEALYLRDPDGNGLELAWDRPEDQWPRDVDGHLSFSGTRLDLEGLLREGLESETKPE